MTAAAIVAVGVGAAVGAWARWGLAAAFNNASPMLPLGTLAANIIGGFFIGVASEILGRHAGVPEELRLLIITGFLGGLTTFSTFSAEVVATLLRGHYGWAFAIAASHLAGSLLATLLGIACVRGSSGG
jgi:fluoride exporter